MPQIWRLHLKQHKQDPLPVIIPMFLYHGKSRWKDRKFSDLMADSASLLPAYVPDFEYVMLDLTQYSDAEIKGAVLCRVVMLLFKYISDPDIMRFENQRHRIMPIVLKNQDIEKLKRIKEAIRTINNVSELSSLIEQ